MRLIRSLHSFQDLERTFPLHQQLVVTSRQKNQHQVSMLKSPVLGTEIKLPLLDPLLLSQLLMSHLPSLFQSIS